MDGWTLEPPGPADPPLLARLAIRAWRVGYRGLLADEVLEGLDETSRAERWRRLAAVVDARGRTPDGRRALVARAPDGPAGTVVVGPARDEEPPAAVELHSLNVDPARWRTGVGRALLAEALPPGPAYLWVLEGNARAIAFYERFGFALDGGRKDDAVHRCTDLRMIR